VISHQRLVADRSVESAGAERESFLEDLGSACRSEYESETGDSVRCGRACACVIWKSRKLAPETIQDLKRNFHPSAQWSTSSERCALVGEWAPCEA